jgi:hypothetical protein
LRPACAREIDGAAAVTRMPPPLERQLRLECGRDHRLRRRTGANTTGRRLSFSPIDLRSARAPYRRDLAGPRGCQSRRWHPSSRVEDARVPAGRRFDHSAPLHAHAPWRASIPRPPTPWNNEAMRNVREIGHYGMGATEQPIPGIDPVTMATRASGAGLKQSWGRSWGRCKPTSKDSSRRATQ